MKSRLITAAIALPILIFSIVAPALFPNVPGLEFLFIAIAAAAFILGLFEYFTLTKKLELKGDAGIAYMGSAGLFAMFVLNAPEDAPDLLLLTAAICVVAVLVSQTFRFRPDLSKMITGSGVTLLGIFYITFLGGFLVSMRVGFDSAPLLSTKLLGFFFAVMMGSDIGALFVGKYLGKHKMVPTISPNKTWEGFAGGIAAAVIAAALSTLLFFPELPYVYSLPLAAVMGVAGVAGDLAESAMKRGAKTKDAANFLPGHGGLLDRLDSLLFSAPILYFFGRMFFQ